MHSRSSFTLCAILTSVLATTAHAFMNPYVRVGFGGNQMAMSDMNAAIAADVGQATAGGVPVTAQSVGPGFGPDVSAGLWVTPFVRVGATYGQLRSRVDHHFSQSGFLYEDDYTFRMSEVGFEAAFRVPGLNGLTFGGGAAQARAEADNMFILNNVHGNYSQGYTTHGDVKTYAAFVGFDQVNRYGVAGFVQLGYHWRDVGPMPGTLEVNDNGTTSSTPGETVPVDYSGWSIRCGLGYDLKW